MTVKSPKRTRYVRSMAPEVDPRAFLLVGLSFGFTEKVGREVPSPSVGIMVGTSDGMSEAGMPSTDGMASGAPVGSRMGMGVGASAGLVIPLVEPGVGAMVVTGAVEDVVGDDITGEDDEDATGAGDTVGVSSAGEATGVKPGGATLDAEGGMLSQHTRYTLSMVGQHSPCKPKSAHWELDSQLAGVATAGALEGGTLGV